MNEQIKLLENPEKLKLNPQNLAKKAQLRKSRTIMKLDYEGGFFFGVI